MVERLIFEALWAVMQIIHRESVGRIPARRGGVGFRARFMASEFRRRRTKFEVFKIDDSGLTDRLDIMARSQQASTPSVRLVGGLVAEIQGQRAR